MGLLGFIFKGGKNLPEADQELANKLEEIGMIKNQLPFKYRGLCNELGLFVQLREARGMVSLKAGGKYRSKIDLWRETPTDPWRVRKYMPGEWETLVEPTLKLAKQLSSRIQFEQELDNLSKEFLAQPDVALGTKIRSKIENWMAANGEDEELLSVLGALAVQLGDYQAGEAAYKRAISLKSDHEPSHRGLGSLYMDAAFAEIRGSERPQRFRNITKVLEIEGKWRSGPPESYEDDKVWVPSQSAKDFGLTPKEVLRAAIEHFEEVVRVTKRQAYKQEALKNLKSLEWLEKANQ